MLCMILLDLKTRVFQEKHVICFICYPISDRNYSMDFRSRVQGIEIRCVSLRTLQEELNERISKKYKRFSLLHKEQK